MPVYSLKSSINLSQCDHRLQTLFFEIIKDFDCSIICGYRSNAEQARLLAMDPPRTKAKPGESKHNDKPSMAVDVLPYPHEEPDLRRFYYFAGFVKSTIIRLNLPIRWGGDWRDELLYTKIDDRKLHTFDDLAHWEVVDE